MVSAAFCFKSRLPICFINNKVNSTGYIELRDNVLITFLDDIDEPSMIFRQDNVSIHKSIIVMDWFNTKNIPLLRWPATSPDL